MDAEVAVVGVGTVGSMTLWRLAAVGVSAIGFEQFGPGHDRSAAGGESRLFRTAYLEGTEYVPLLFAAQRLWRRLESESGRDLLTMCGGLMIGDQDSEHIKTARACCEQFDLPHTVLEPDQVAERFPQHRLVDGEVAIHDEQSGLLRPEYAVVTAAQQAVAAGARLQTGCRIAQLDPDADGVTVTADDGRSWRVRRVVVTTGPWAQALQSAAAVTPRRILLSWFTPPDIDAYRPDRFPIFVRENDQHRVFGTPSVEGTTVKVGLVTPFADVEDPDRLERSVSVAEEQLLAEASLAFLPELWRTPSRLAAYMDGYTTDGHGVLGPDPGRPNVLLGVGFSGHGFKLAPVLGQALADLAGTGDTELGVAHLAPGRPGLHA
ncbi:N-methyl-L-tryptophan oxidase [Saccharopolyspora sp. WRP15-2]|uniref:N-methyl-L-tryptophan oxidase n=1 Tax=Saccharopolyspora oryzae TaxID=2997343 RepID=A0ABT4UWT5_9PSEU|nr:N-methyl-L-tryptophan oxidase [Saccharopolyspora oryzae]MDA3626159.1 N-methyl-L-tryptophan oxidase [Saccharopolyspora oryzae]